MLRRFDRGFEEAAEIRRIGGDGEIQIVGLFQRCVFFVRSPLQMIEIHELAEFALNPFFREPVFFQRVLVLALETALLLRGVFEARA